MRNDVENHEFRAVWKWPINNFFLEARGVY